MVDFSFIPVAEASVVSLMQSINKVIINPIIIFLFACAMAYFLYGLAQYLLSPGNEEVHKKSKSVMLWGVIGLFIMVAVFGIMRVLLTTVGENKIKINGNGDYVVDKISVDGTGSFVAPNSGTLADKTIADSKSSGQGLFKDTLDVSSDTNAPDLSAATFITNPFPAYEPNAQCWNNANKPFLSKARTEYDALTAVRAQARTKYLSDNHLLPEKDPDQEKKAKYPMTYSTKVLYDKKNKIYYAWLDARAPIGNASLSNCNLEINTPAPEIAASLISSEVDVSNSLEAVDLPPATFTQSPFPAYKPDALCWNKAITSGKATTEYNALTKVNALIREQYLSETGTSAKDKTKANYPIKYASTTLFDKKEKAYYAWVDARAPIKTGTTANCQLEILTPAPTTPESIVFSGQLNLSTTILKSGITDYTKSPFTQIYMPNSYCWRKEISANATTEFKAFQDIAINARKAYLTDNNLTDSQVQANLPITYGALSAFDKVTKQYYVWWDVRAPIKLGTSEDCNLLLIGSTDQLPPQTAQSTKRNPFATPYISDDQYYRAVGSGVDKNYSTAREIAITNALIQIAHLKRVNTIDGIAETVIDEKYYLKDLNTGNYDFWVAIESPR